MTRRRGLGRRIARDERDWCYPIRARKAKRTRRMWRDTYWSGDQENTPHCVGFGWVHWLANVPVQQWLDPHGIYRLAEFLDEWPGETDEGTSVRAGAKVLANLGLISAYHWGMGLGDLESTLLEVSPVVLGTNWYAGMDKPDKQGVVRAKGRLLGGHCYVATGIDTREAKIRCKNSWGKTWGQSGRFWLSFEDVARLIAEDGEVCLAIEAPARRPVQ